MRIRRSLGVVDSVGRACLGWLILAALNLSPAAAQFDGANDLDAAAAFDLDAAGTDLARSCVVLPDGGIILAGSASDDDGESSKIVLAKFLSTGGLDPSFGVAGKVVIDQSDLGFSFTTATAGALAVTSDRLFVAGYREDPIGSSYQTFLLRLQLDGSIDTAFGSNGWLGLSHISSIVDMEISPQTLDIWLLGKESSAADGYFWLLKIDRFENELFATGFNAGANGFLSDLELQPDGKALVVGTLDADGGAGFRGVPALWRRLANGFQDPAVGNGTGFLVYDDGDSRMVRSVGVLPDGRLVLQGTFGAFAAEDLFVKWLLANASPDSSIGNHTVGFDLGGSGRR